MYGRKKYLDYTGKPVFRVYPTGFIRNDYTNDTKKRRKNNFIVFGVKGFIHKGNDLLIEVFSKHPEWNLYLCGNDIEKECKELNYKLTKNIYNCGFIETGSSQFYELMEICSFALLPSCSEGMSTALLTCMCHGIIPITMAGTGMDDLPEWCEFFEGFKLENIENKIIQVQCNTQEKINEKSSMLFKYSRQRFSLAAYSNHMEYALKHIFFGDGSNIE